MPWHSRLRNVFRPARLDEELDNELQFHLAETVDRLINEGVPEPEARRQARRSLGSYLLQKERTRDMNVAGWLDTLRGDLSYALRQFKLNPGFAAVAVLSLALGIGANTAIFQLLDAIRLRGLPVKDPGQLVTIDRGGNPDDFFIAGSYSSREQAFSYAQMEALSKHQQAFSSMLTFWPTRLNLSVAGESRYAEALLVSSNFLDVLGVEPIAGRGFSAEDDRVACSSGSAVLSYGFWQREFGGNLNAIGKTISLDAHRFPIAGITPPSFFGVEPGQRFDVALPLCADNVFANGKGRVFDKMSFWLTPIARLKPGWSVDRASKHVMSLSPTIFRETLPAEYTPDFAKAYLKNKFKVISASAGVSALRGQFTDPLWMLMAITGAVLLIACANLANLLLARASAREREIAVRQAVGASRPRLMMQLITESLLIAAAGTAIGMCLAQGLSRSLVAFLNGDGNSISVPMGLDWHLFGFLAALAVLTCVLFGLAPALRASGASPAAAMQGARTSTTNRERKALRRTLVIIQVALSLVLLVGALLFSRSLHNLLATNLGFDSRNLLVTSVTANGLDFASAQKRRVLFRELEDRIGSLGDVSSVSMVAYTPFSRSGWNMPVHADNDPARTGGKNSWFNRAGPHYFGTMGTRILAGRVFNRHDDLNAPKVAVVNESFAKQFFGGKNPVGRTFRVEELAGKPDDVYEIIGLVADTKYNDIREPEPSFAFFPIDQDEQPGNTVTFVIRSGGRLDSCQRDVERTMMQVNSNLLLDFRVLDVQIQQSLLRERLMANLSVGFGILAACLSMLGLYGVMSYIVVRRRNEIGLRMALGANKARVLRLVLSEALLLLGLGLAAGISLALWAGKAAAAVLFGLPPNDVVSLIGASGLLLMAALLASYMPARRAAGLDPITTLRNE